jgi:hypothetical protein
MRALSIGTIRALGHAAFGLGITLGWMGCSSSSSTGTGSMDAAADSPPGSDASKPDGHGQDSATKDAAKDAGRDVTSSDDTGTGDTGTGDTGTGDTGAGDTGAKDTGTGDTGVDAGCTSVSDCPAPASDCVSATCVAGVCGTSDLAAETACTSGGAVCDGQGHCVACVSAADCSGTTCAPQVCTTNACAAGTLASKGTACTESGGTVCDGMGSCVAPTCTDGIRDGNETDVDCGGAALAGSAACPPCPVGKDCVATTDCAPPTACMGTTYTAATTCTGGVCTAGASTNCATTMDVCNPTNGCVECNTAADCALGDDCTAGVCGACTPVASTDATSPATIPAGWKVTCLTTPCPVVQCGELTFWAFSDVNNGTDFGVTGYDPLGNIVKGPVTENGARYIQSISVDTPDQEVTLTGQQGGPTCGCVTVPWSLFRLP